MQSECLALAAFLLRCLRPVAVLEARLEKEPDQMLRRLKAAVVAATEKAASDLEAADECVYAAPAGEECYHCVPRCRLLSSAGFRTVLI